MKLKTKPKKNTKNQPTNQTPNQQMKIKNTNKQKASHKYNQDIGWNMEI